MPSRPTVNGWSSSIVSPGFAAPTALELEVSTARSTPALSASSKTFRVPPTFTSKTRIRSLLRIDVVPATWKTRSTPRIALRTESRSVTSPSARSHSIPVERLGVAAIADQQPELVASTGQLPGDVEAHEARPTGDERLPHSVRMLESLNALDRGGRRHDLLSPA